MGLGADVRALRAELRRLEDAAGKGRRNCLYCRLHVVRRLADPAAGKPRRECVVRTRCEECGSEYCVNLTRFSARDREVYRLYLSYTLEDYYIDPKAHALFRWLLRPGRNGSDEGEGHRSNSALRKRAARRRGAVKLAELMAHYDALVDTEVEALRAKYGIDPFPELTARAESIMRAAHKGHDPALITDAESRKEFDECEREERALLVRIAMERFVFDRVWPETQEELAAVRVRIDLLLEGAREQQQLEEEREARRLEEEARRREEQARRREAEEALRRDQEEARLREEAEAAKRREFLRKVLPPSLCGEY